jgi:hypothetical protein
MDPLALAHAARRFPTIGALFLAGAAGIVTWFFLNAEVFTPLQRYYWDEYLNTEMFQGTKGNYRLLEVVDRRGEHRIAIDSDVTPAAIHGRQLVPFVLSAQARHSGAIDLAVDTVHYGSAQMHQVLATSIYDGRSVMELSGPAWGVGLGVFAFCPHLHQPMPVPKQLSVGLDCLDSVPRCGGSDSPAVTAVAVAHPGDRFSAFVLASLESGVGRRSKARYPERILLSPSACWHETPCAATRTGSKSRLLSCVQKLGFQR